MTPAETPPTLELAAEIRNIFGDRTEEAGDEMLIAGLEVIAERLPDEDLADCLSAAENARKAVGFSRAWGASMRILIGLSMLAAGEEESADEEARRREAEGAGGGDG